MPRITVDPNTEICPDYTTEAFAGARAALTAGGVAAAEAATVLKTIWTQGNDAAKIAWQLQVEEDAAADAERQRVAAEEQREIDVMKHEEEKKRKAKFLPIMVGVAGPTTTPLVLAPAVVKKFERGEYVHLHHLTTAALERVSKDPGSLLDSSLQQVKTPNGVAWATQADIDSARGVVDDHDLAWGDWLMATQRFNRATETANWPREWRMMFMLFWANITQHELALSPDSLDRKALLLFASERRKLWHSNLNTTGAFDISILDEVLIRKAQDRVYRIHRAEVDRVLDTQVRASSL
ncbi:hypothetical protein D9611_006674 [Ephemerocybe angulata]|uniref:Uncharacterized protein n=1 Tax=Ephemerocybe angulata TaxID=980116 RepID=A0A8H5C7L1_9AGAR|nr:hypothetical protein D9611_002312 [Tulosesus angulatus]KAF5336621.1 hypothetical protein D9611_006674 [Tulosesus angulatus]